MNNIYQELDNKCSLEDVSEELQKINDSYQNMLKEVNKLYTNLNLKNQLNNTLEIQTLRSNYKDLPNNNENQISIDNKSNKRKGKWQWKSFALKGGLAIPWEAESVINSSYNSSCFKWEAGKTYIIIEQIGVYKLNFVLIKKSHFINDNKNINNNNTELKEVVVQILLDGEIISTLYGNLTSILNYHFEEYNNKDKSYNFNNRVENNSNQKNHIVNSNRSKINESLKSLTLRSNNEERTNVYNNHNYCVNKDSNISNNIFSGKNSTLEYVSFNEIISIPKSKSKVAICLLKEEQNLEGYLSLSYIAD